MFVLLVLDVERGVVSGGVIAVVKLELVHRGGEASRRKPGRRIFASGNVKKVYRNLGVPRATGPQITRAQIYDFPGAIAFFSDPLANARKASDVSPLHLISLSQFSA